MRNNNSENREGSSGISLLSDTLERFFSDCTSPSIIQGSRLNGWTQWSHAGSNDTWAYAPLLDGGFALRHTSEFKTIYHCFNPTGEITSSSPEFTSLLVFVDLKEFFPNQSVINHLFNTLAYEYEQAKLGLANTARVLLLEKLLKKALIQLKNESGTWNDKSLTIQIRNWLEHEDYSSLNYSERLALRKKFFSEIDAALTLKRRVLGISPKFAAFVDFFYFRKLQIQAFFMKLGVNFRGLSYRVTIGNLIWFFTTVKGNIGYSIALAIYGPFTFYFITQPMNPHAMWAVGRVRDQVLKVTESVQATAIQLGIMDPVGQSLTDDTVKTSQAAPLTAPIASAPKEVTLKNGRLRLTGDLPASEQPDWNDRMGHFKSMQIGYEEAMEFSARMGRIEQMETQLNFPLICESSYREMERYRALLERVNTLVGQASKSNSNWATYYESEIATINLLEVYLWDRMVRFMLDNAFIVLDQAREQRYVDSYFGRGFIFLEELTGATKQRYPDLKLPVGYERIGVLAKFYEGKGSKSGNLLARYRKNSILSSQEDHLSSTELRTYMKRQWEILYLQQSKAQEASHFGMLTYFWSVRNVIWAMESFFSTRRQELSLFEKDLRNGGTGFSTTSLGEIKTQIEPLLESLFHIVTLEFVSIRKELEERLPNDLEASIRLRVIAELEKSLATRQKLLE